MKEQRVQLSDEDRTRIVRLYEEAYSRLYEAALIMSRTLQSKGDLGGFLFDSRKEATNKKGLVVNQTTARVAKVYIRVGGSCGVYDYENGECYEVPVSECE